MAELFFLNEPSSVKSASIMGFMRAPSTFQMKSDCIVRLALSRSSKVRLSSWREEIFDCMVSVAGYEAVGLAQTLLLPHLLTLFPEIETVVL